MAPKEELEKYKQLVVEKFPELGDAAQYIATNVNEADKLPASDIAVCTQWATAYVLAKYNHTKRKCYFIQDREASFYPKGTISALVENTYKFGFLGIANTPGLLKWYEQQYGGKGVVLKSVVNLSAYAPDRDKPLVLSKPYKVFFYGRPNEPRNAFELGIAALLKLKEQMGADLEIYTAGAQWDPTTYGVDKIITNLGKISYARVPAFYRSMDAGLMFMFSGHPGVVASDLMASGCPVVVNEYNDETWHELYQHEQTCLVATPTAAEVAYNLHRALTDSALRKQLIDGGLAKAKHFYEGYDASFEAVLSHISKPTN
jgi:glycosyltransferase involved in cell wall biosynthesis